MSRPTVRREFLLAMVTIGALLAVAPLGCGTGADAPTEKLTPEQKEKVRKSRGDLDPTKLPQKGTTKAKAK